MKSLEELRRENDMLRESISMLNSASLRISASLDLETVLQEVVENARALTRARYGVIVTMGQAGQPIDFLTSGLTDEKQRQLMDWSEGNRLFEHFRDLPGALRLPDVQDYVRLLGFSPELLPFKTFQCMPMRHRTVHVGSFFLTDKEGGEDFTDEDEGFLVLFASQAAAAIVNARTYQAEQRARADLEALVETSPVGVVVFDAGTGRPSWLNREARRIVEVLVTPGSTPEALLEQMTLKRADGREIALDQFPLSQALVHAENIRAEEMVLSVPDGRSISTLVNCTPIHTEKGEVVSVVVTMQDLAPIQEMERLRTAFISMVSHELRAPLTSIKGSAATLMEESPGLDPAETREFSRIIMEQADHMRRLIGDLLDAGRIDTGTLSVAPEATDVSFLVDRARSTFQSGGSTHTFTTDLPHNLPRVMADRSRIVQVLNNLLVNAARHAPGSSNILVSAVHDGQYVEVTVRDEGSGMAPEMLPYLFQKHVRLDETERSSNTAGTRLGLAICKGLVEAHGGRIWAESAGIGQGTSIMFTIPVAQESSIAGPGSDQKEAQDKDGVFEPTRILVVDDDPQMLRYIRDALTESGFDTIVTGDHTELSSIIRTEEPELVLLDLLLPDADGIELMGSVPELADLPVIFISAYGRDETIAKALEIGADDYLVKPFSSTELVARIRTSLRRRADPEPFILGDLAINYDQRLVSVAGVRVELTAKEYELLRVLSLNAGRVSTFDAVIRQVWGEYGYANNKLVRSLVKSVRRKIGDDARAPDYILNERGVGYRMARSRRPQGGN